MKFKDKKEKEKMMDEN